MNYHKGLSSAILALFFLLFLVSSTWGHAAIVWAYVENNQVQVEAFYASGKKVQNAKVVVMGKDGKTHLEGKTDKEGKYSYVPVSKDSQTIVVIAGESHIGDFELSAEELVNVSLKKNASAKPIID